MPCVHACMHAVPAEPSRSYVCACMLYLQNRTISLVHACILYLQKQPSLMSVCACCICRTNKLQVMRVESTDGKHQDIGLFLDPPTAMRVLEKVRSLQPLKPWQFKTSELSSTAFCVCISVCLHLTT